MEAERGKFPAVISVPLIESPAHQYSVHEHFDLSIQTKYLNYSGRTIRMGTRNGVVYDIPPRADRHRQEFIVRQEIHMSDNIKSAVRDRLINHDGIESEDLKSFKKLFMDAYRDQERGVTLKFDYLVTPAEIIHQGGCIYITELDIILSTKQDSIPLHPFSLEAMSITHKGVRTITEAGLGVVLIDNNEMIGPRFTRIMGKVVRVDPIRNSLKPDGAYVSYRGIMETAQDSVRDVIDFIPVAELEEAGWLFRSYAEARHSLEREVEVNFELKELEVEGKRLAAESSVKKGGIDLEKLTLEQSNATLQRELEESERQRKLAETEMQRRFDQEDHRTKLEQLRTKDYYEEKSNTRKDTSELVKFIPSLLLGAGAAILAMKALF